MSARRWSLVVFLSLLVGALSASGASAATVVLKFYDTAGTGTELTAAQVKTVMHGSGGSDSDALLDLSTMQDIYEYPLYRSGSPARWRFDTVAGTPSAFSVNWPTATNGYSTVIIDNGGAGYTAAATVVFNYQAALDEKRRLDAAITARPSYVPSAAYTTAYNQAVSLIASANAATTDSDRGKYGQQALDAVDRAYSIMLQEYGPAYANAHSTNPWFGLTLDDPAVYTSWATLYPSVVGTSRGWVRIVFDPTRDGGNPSYYSAAVTAAKNAGLKVLGQPVDSGFANQYTRAQYLARFKSYVDYYPQVDAWEVGNEVNGCWTDSTTNASGDCTSTLLPVNDRMKNKIADAAAYVRSTRPAAKTVLTLYWELGTDAAKWSTFNWVRAGNLPAATRAQIDTVLLSTYVEDAPMGLAFDQTMNELHAEFPSQSIGLGELDYWAPDTSQYYWAYDASNTTNGRHAVASHYYAAMLGYPSSIGGGFWWYGAEELPGDTALQSAIHNVVTAVP